MREFGGWGGTPVAALGVERQRGVESGIPGPFVAWVRRDQLPRRPRALLACIPLVGASWPAAQRGPLRLAGGGRAQRGLDLFLGQNRTKRGSGDAKAP